jgi:hypothetical protein
MAKISKIIARSNGSEVRITAEAFCGLELTHSIGVYVHIRESLNADWKLCSDRLHPDWRNMSVDHYIEHGRSEMLQVVSPGEILKTTSALSQQWCN